jgi:uncharacterized membrane-anchored protein
MIRLLTLTLFVLMLYFGFSIASTYDTNVQLQFLDYVVSISSFFLIGSLIISGVFIAFISKILAIIINAPKLISNRIKTSQLQHSMRGIMDAYGLAISGDPDSAKKVIDRAKMNLQDDFAIHPHLILSVIDPSPEQRTYHLRYLLDSSEYKGFAAKGLARYFLGHKYYQQALDYAEQALHLRSDDSELLEMLIELYASMLMWDQFEEMVVRLGKIDPYRLKAYSESIAHLYFVAAKEALASGSDDQAIYYLEQAMIYKIDFLDAASILFPLLINTGNMGRSRQFLRAAFAANPSFELFELYAKSGDEKAPEVYSELAMLADPKNNVGLFIAITTCLGMHDEAKRLIEAREIEAQGI